MSDQHPSAAADLLSRHVLKLLVPAGSSGGAANAQQRSLVMRKSWQTEMKRGTLMDSCRNLLVSTGEAPLVGLPGHHGGQIRGGAKDMLFYFPLRAAGASNFTSHHSLDAETVSLTSTISPLRLTDGGLKGSPGQHVCIHAGCKEQSEGRRLQI